MPARALRLAIHALLLAGCLAAAPARGEAALHAVVVGIDKYVSARKPLQGAVADAKDIADALRGIGATPTLLVDGQATREAILGALYGMIDRARPGDTVVFTYAGHGGLAPALDPASEKTGLDQVMLLGGFTPTPPGNGQRIVDDEIYNWLQKALKAGVRPVVVFDACHSGTMYRSVDARAGDHQVRAAPIEIRGRDALAGVIRPASGPPGLPTGAFSYAAALDNEEVPEIYIPGVGKRGAFSYAFAGALRGKADADGDGWITHQELMVHLMGETRTLTESRQNPNLEPRSEARREKLFHVATTPVPPPPNGDPPVRLRLLGLPTAAAADLARDLKGAALVQDPSQPVDLVWDAAQREAVSGTGDIVATDLSQGNLPGLIEKWRALGRLKALGKGSALVMRALPDDHARVQDDKMGLAVEAVNGAALTIFNLSGDGTVNFLYPKSATDVRQPPGDFRMNPFTYATAPFGAEHLVALTTAAPPTALHEVLRRAEGQVAPLAVTEAALAAVNADPRGRLGIQAIVSKPK